MWIKTPVHIFLTKWNSKEIKAISEHICNHLLNVRIYLYTNSWIKSVVFVQLCDKFWYWIWCGIKSDKVVFWQSKWKMNFRQTQVLSWTPRGGVVPTEWQGSVVWERRPWQLYPSFLECLSAVLEKVTTGDSIVLLGDKGHDWEEWPVWSEPNRLEELQPQWQNTVGGGCLWGHGEDLKEVRANCQMTEEGKAEPGPGSSQQGKITADLNWGYHL